MTPDNNAIRQKKHRLKKKDSIYQERSFVQSRTSNISPFVQFALSLHHLYTNRAIDKDLIDNLIADAVHRVEKCENILVARSLKRRMEEFILKGKDIYEEEKLKS